MKQLVFEHILKKIGEKPAPKPREIVDIDKVMKLCAEIALKRDFQWKHGDTEYKAMDAIFNSNGCLLIGQKGTGKTLCLSLAADLWGLMRGSYAFTTTSKIALKYQNTGSDVLLQLEKAVLFLDELGSEEVRSNSFGNKIDPISNLLALRYDSKQPIYCTSNLTIEQINTRYGERLADRFKEMFNVVIFKGESLRGKK